MAFLRQQGIVPPDKLAELSVVIVGSGAIGSFTALTLTKMGVKKITMYDNDVVALHNVSNQFFTIDSIGKLKVEAAAAECQRHSPDGELSLLARGEFYSGQPIEADIVIALTDNIEGRAAAFKASQESFSTRYFIDARMGSELLRVFALEPKNITLAKKYQEEFLEGVENSIEPCTERTIVYTVLMASAMIASYVKKFVMGEPAPFQFAFSFKDFNQMKSKVGEP
jgi:molybdopterin/thiamine biosynthesis adenylyltransferase